MPKKKGGKMGNMTEEERLLFLEQQRLAEEEMQKNKEDMLAQFLKVCYKLQIVTTVHMEWKILRPT